MINHEKKHRDRKIIRNQYIFKTKENQNSTFGKKKVRLVAKSCPQRPGEDLFETYSPVAQVTSVRILATLSA